MSDRTGQIFCIEVFEKMSFESLDTLSIVTLNIVSNDNNIINIYYKKDAPTGGRMKEKNRIIYFTSSYTKLYQGRATFLRVCGWV